MTFVTFLRTFVLAMVLSGALFLTACGAPEIALVGVVKDDYTGQPVPAVTLTIGDQSVTTDATGRYRLTRWTVKDALQLRATGYASATVALTTYPNLAQATPPSVTLDLALRPDTLTGTIVDAYTKQPVAGALVQTQGMSATTGSDGSFALAGLPESYTLHVSKADYAPRDEPVQRRTNVGSVLRPNTLAGSVTDRRTKQPLAGVTVKLGSVSLTTGADGAYQLKDVPETASIQLSADGYDVITKTFIGVTRLDAELRANLLKARLVDAQSGKPISFATIIAAPELGASDSAFTRIDNSSDGTFTLKGLPEQGVLQVLAPGYRKAVIAINGGTLTDTITLEPFVTKGLYITAAMAASNKQRPKYFDLIDRTELNAIVIDLKSDLRDDLGLVYYDSQVPLVKELSLSHPYMDLPTILAEAKQRGIYTIARVHMFSHDNVLADAKPEWAAKDRTTGEVFADYPGPGIRYAWLDPWNENVWNYNIALSVEAAKLGFDEINFDYIRFPSLEFDPNDKNRIQLSRENSTPEERYANIDKLLERAQRAINGAGSYLSIDVFGYTSFRPDELIGQNLSILSKHTDYIMPMIYPSHFSPGEFGMDNPARYPYEIINKSLTSGVQQVVGNRAMLRPWLQDFTLTWVPDNLIVEYGPTEVRAQIKAVEDFRVNAREAGWVLYDSANNYTEAALSPR